MGTFITQTATPTLYDSGTKSVATVSPPQLPTGWTIANVTTTTDLNNVSAALQDVRTDIRAHIINVKHYGATGDGTTDDTTAIAAALTAGAGKIVFFPPGTYVVGASVLPAADTVVDGGGLATLTAKAAYVGSCFQVDVARVTIRGLRAVGFNEFTDVNGGDDFTIQNCRLSASVGTGIGVISGAARVRVLDNYVTGTTGMGMSIHGCTDIIVSRNQFKDTGDNSIAVRVLTTGSVTEKCVISGNVIENAGKAGIKFCNETSSTAGTQALRASITGNVIKKWASAVGEAAISIDNNLASTYNQDISVVGNSIESANRALETYYISAQRVKGAVISGNTCQGGVASSGIQLASGSDKCIVSNNYVGTSCVSTVDTTTGGISLTDTNYFTVSGNVVYNAGNAGANRPGIFIKSSQYGTVIGNVCTDDRGGSAAMSYGVNMSSTGATKTDYCTVAGNVSFGHVTSPLDFGVSQLHQLARLNLGNSNERNFTLSYSAGAATRVISHGLDGTPTRIYLTPTSTIGSAAKYWVTSPNASNFVLNFDVDPGSTVTMYCRVGYGSE